MKPTYLYIKQHTVTGLRYFGKTIRNPNKYKGSGTYWQRHLKVHGREIDTIWVELFNDEESLTDFAEFFSEFFNIVNSKTWANLVGENGLDGGQFITETTREKMAARKRGIPLSQDTKDKMRAAIRPPRTLETGVKISQAKKGKTFFTDDHRLKMSQAAKNTYSSNSFSRNKRQDFSI